MKVFKIVLRDQQFCYSTTLDGRHFCFQSAATAKREARSVEETGSLGGRYLPMSPAFLAMPEVEAFPLSFAEYAAIIT